MKLRSSVRNFIGRIIGAQNDMDVLWATNMPIIYINNPKCGCSTMKRSLRSAQASLPHLRHVPVVAGPHEPDHLLKHKGLGPRGSRTRYVISCVRNPYTRALSGYLDKIHGQEFKAYRVFHRRPVRNFEDHLEAMLSYTPLMMEPHLRPQYLNLNYPAISYDAMFYLERIEHFQNFLTRFIPDSSIQSLRSHATSAGSKLREHYTPRAVELVQRIYRKDFELFGYDLDIENVGFVPGDLIIDEKPASVCENALPDYFQQPRQRATFNPLARTLFCHRLAELKII